MPPLIWTTELVRNPLPVTVKLKVAPPATTLGGLMPVIEGVAWALAAGSRVVETASTTKSKIPARRYGRHFIEEPIEANISQYGLSR